MGETGTGLKRWRLKLAARGGKRSTVIAVPRKLGILLHQPWVTGDVYEPLRNATMQHSGTRHKNRAIF
jgi:hypothetical protein